MPAIPGLPVGTIGISLRIRITCVTGHAVAVAVASTLAGSYTTVATHLGSANDLVRYSDVLIPYTPTAFDQAETLYFQFTRSGTTTVSVNTKVDIYLIAFHC
jgi:hypothetical protein